MENLTPMLILLAGIIIGGLAVWFVRSSHVKNAYDKATTQAEAEKATLLERLTARTGRIEELESEVRNNRNNLATLQDEKADLKADARELGAKVEEGERLLIEQRAILEKAEQALTNTFKALSADALKSNNQSFIELANATFEKLQQSAKGDLESRQKAIEEIIKPVRESLDKVDKQVKEIEKDRTTAYVSLTEQVKALATTHTQLQSETSNLVKALRTPNIRGRWGEIQLKRVVELAGMLEHCDFVQQVSADVADGRLRPDLIIRLPAGRTIVVDAKVPWDAFYDSLSITDDELRRSRLMDHARLVRQHIGGLGKKSYWDAFKPTPEFVLMFLPSETFYSAALEHDPKLIEQGVEQGVILATPTTLIALLKAVSYGWRQEQMADSAKKISDLGAELYERLVVTAGHLKKLGGALGGAVNAYNEAIGSIESRVLVSGRRLKEYKVVGDSSKEIAELEPLDHTTRVLQSQEMAGLFTDTPPTEESLTSISVENAGVRGIDGGADQESVDEGIAKA